MDELLRVIRQIDREGATFGTSGNASARRDREAFFITPSGVPWPDISADDMVTLATDGGAVLHGHRRPSTEWRFHQYLYRAHDWIGGIVHLHSPYATVLETINRPVQAIHYQMVRVGDLVPVVPYRTFGTPELAEAIEAVIRPNCRAALLENHGLAAVGETVSEAYQAAMEVEWTAMIQYRASLLAQPRVLSSDELRAVRESFRHYGQHPTT